MSENKKIIFTPSNYPCFSFSPIEFYEIKSEEDLKKHVEWIKFCSIDSYLVDENNKAFLEEKNKELDDLFNSYQERLAILRKEQEELDLRKKNESQNFLAQKDEILKELKKEAYLKKYQKINE